MSYDIYFLEPADAANPQALFERLEDGPTPNTPKSEARKQAVVEALRGVDPALEPFPFDHAEIAQSLGISIEEAREAYSHVELNGPDDAANGVQVTVNSDHVSVTIAYWHSGADAAGIFSLVARYADAIVASGGYRIYDPQVERVADKFGEVRADALETYARMVDKIPDIVASSATEKRKPWWKFW